jgi:hypothetical protein
MYLAVRNPSTTEKLVLVYRPKRGLAFSLSQERNAVAR